MQKDEIAKEENHHKSYEILPYVPNHRTIAADYNRGYEKLRFPGRMRENKSMAIVENEDKDDRSHKFSFASYVSISSDKCVNGYLKVEKEYESKIFLLKYRP